MRYFKLLAALALLALPAQAQLPMTGAGSVAGGGGPPPLSGKLLLVDGVSFLLQTDAASKICLAGGC